MKRASHYALVSLAAAIVTIALKTAAWRVSGSVSMLSDAAESLVNLVAALSTWFLLRWSAEPADREHAHGHEKGEHIAAAFEGALILVAAAGIVAAAVNRLLHPQPLGDLGWGAALSAIATAVNGGVGLLLVRVGRKIHSEALEADGHHLLTDVFTSVAAIAGILLVRLTGKAWIDPAGAALIAGFIVVTATRILKGAAIGLLDASLPEEEVRRIEEVLRSFDAEGAKFHALRTRRAGQRRFVTIHVLVPGAWSVKRGHDLCEAIEEKIGALFPRTTVLTHLEPVEDSASYEDEALDRASKQVT